MNKRIFTVLIIALLLAVIVLGCLWQIALHDNSEMELLAQSGASEAYTRFTDFQENGHESDYWGGVAAFNTFQNAYHLLVEDTSKSANTLFCNEVYGSLLLSPEQSQANISEIVEIMGTLANDVNDENGHSRMYELRNTLKQ